MIAMLAILVGPVLVGVLALLFGKGKRVTPVEFVAMEAICIGVACAMWGLTLRNMTKDTEIWNGVITTKSKDTEGCCHSYRCRCHEECSGTGKNRSCHEECDTCYEHDQDDVYTSKASTGDTAFRAGCLAPGTPAPKRWQEIVLGEPASFEHSYTNYLRGNPDSILRRRGISANYRIPNYPKVYDIYRIRRVLLSPDKSPVAVKDFDALDQGLDTLLGDLGHDKQVNVIVVVTESPDREYAEALRQAWLGGKKNDVILVIGAPDFPDIAWAEVVSWTRREDFKVALRDEVEGFKKFEPAPVLGAIRKHVLGEFVRRPMSDFEYLWATTEPSTTTTIWIGIGSLILSIVLTLVFWHTGPFGAGRYSIYRVSNRRFR